MRTALATACVLTIGFAAPRTIAADTASAPAGTLVLNESSNWRAFYVWRTPLVAAGAELKDAVDGWGYDATVVQTPAPPDGWAAPDFSDTGWVRYSINPAERKEKEFDYGFRSAGAPGAALAELCLRARFQVDDPASVKHLVLSLTYRGGVVVYLNGAEVSRGHLPKNGALSTDTFADAYPREAFLKANGQGIQVDHGDPKSNAEGLAKRLRTLPPIEIPPGLIRKGVNVLALEFHRTHYQGNGLQKEGLGYRSVWSTCGLVSAELRADGGAQPNLARPAGVQVWGASPLSRTRPWQWADPLDPPQPIAITACRNGVFTGKVVVSSDAALTGVRAEASDLKQTAGSATIPAKNVSVLYSIRDDKALMRYSLLGGYWDTLAETPPADVPVTRVPTAGNGAIQPIIVKVRVAADAAPGDYRGTLRATVGGQPDVTVPIELRVVGWTLPDPRDYATLMGIVESPESVAAQYEVPLWSEEHWRYLEGSLQLLGELGNNYVCTPLVAHTNFGNEESMVRWVKEGDTYKPDFSVMDRYLDLAQKYMHLRVVFFYLWDRYQDSRQWAGKADTQREGAKVTLVDPATGRTEVMSVPRLVTPEGKAFWKSAWDQVMARMTKRALADAAMLGTNGDGWGPTKDLVAAYQEIAPGVKWVSSAHADVGNTWSGMVVGYNSRVYNALFPAPGQADRREAPDGRYFGWKTHRNLFPREGCEPSLHPVATPGEHRVFLEAALLSNNAGLGRTGLDFWPLLGVESTKNRGLWNDKRSQTLTARFMESGWDQLNMDTATEALTAPGPKGAITTERFEQLREGLQECQARIAIEKAILSGRLDAESVKRSWRVLDDRAWRIRAAHIGSRPDYLESTDAFGSPESLFRLAAEVE